MYIDQNNQQQGIINLSQLVPQLTSKRNNSSINKVIQYETAPQQQRPISLTQGQNIVN
jgi:hypothetical protein